MSRERRLGRTISGLSIRHRNRPRLRFQLGEVDVSGTRSALLLSSSTSSVASGKRLPPLKSFRSAGRWCPFEDAYWRRWWYVCTCNNNIAGLPKLLLYHSSLENGYADYTEIPSSPQYRPSCYSATPTQTTGLRSRRNDRGSISRQK